MKYGSVFTFGVQIWLAMQISYTWQKVAGTGFGNDKALHKIQFALLVSRLIL